MGGVGGMYGMRGSGREEFAELVDSYDVARVQRGRGAGQVAAVVGECGEFLVLLVADRGGQGIVVEIGHEGIDE